MNINSLKFVLETKTLRSFPIINRMSSKFNWLQVKPTYYSIFLLFCTLCVCISEPVAVNRVSYKEDATISPRRYKDKFTYKKGYKTISTNGSSEDQFRAECKGSGCSSGKEGELPKLLNRLNSADLGEPYFLDRSKSISPGGPNFSNSVKSYNPGQPKFLDRVKSVSPGEKTMRQSDDDDDDDDGGEYEGLGDSGNLSEKTLCDKKDPSVPVMIFRQLDMVAMGIPMKDSPKDKDGDKTADVYKGAQGRRRASCRQREQSGLEAGSGYKWP